MLKSCKAKNFINKNIYENLRKAIIEEITDHLSDFMHSEEFLAYLKSKDVSPISQDDPKLQKGNVKEDELLSLAQRKSGSKTKNQKKNQKKEPPPK